MHAARRLSLALLGIAIVSAAMVTPLDLRRVRAQTDEDPAGLIAMAAAADRRGDYPAALNAYQHALTIEQASGDTAGVPATLVGLGNVYHHVGRYDQALQAYNQARTLDAGSGQLLVDIGAVYHDLGQYDQALRAYDAGLVLLRQAGDGLGEAAALSNVGVTYDRQGRNEEALGAYQRALELQRGRDARGPAGITLGNIGLVLDHLKRPGEAQAADNQALSVLREVGDRRAEAIVLANLGLLDEERFRLEQALTGYRAAIQIQEELRTGARIDEFKAGLADQQTAVYEHAVQVLLRLGRGTEAFDMAERSRARNFLDQIGNARINARADADPAQVDRERMLRLSIAEVDLEQRAEQAKPTSDQDRAAVAARATQLADLRQQYQSVVAALKVSSPEYASLVTITPLSVQGVQQALSADTTLVSYFVLPAESVAFVFTAGSFNAVELPDATEGALGAELTGLRMGSRDADPGPGLQRLYRWLVQPILPLLNTSVVGIVPHKMLHYVPFAALGDGARVLADSRALFELPSASTLPFVNQQRKGGPVSVLALGAGQVEGVPPIPGADTEAQTVADLYGGDALLDADATATAFKARAPDYRILHLAAHGQLNANSPLFSRVLLAPDPAQGDDGSLTVGDVFDLDLQRADLVVLSACDSGLGVRVAGDDLVGLSRAFIHAGTPSLIASLWNVNDAATAVLMTAFYRQLQTGVGKAEALRAAELETRAQYPQPYYWAGFVLTGDSGPLTGPPIS